MGFKFISFFLKYCENLCAAIWASVWSDNKRWGRIWEKQRCACSYWLLRHSTHPLQQAVCCLGSSINWIISVSISWTALHIEYQVKYFILHLFEVKFPIHIDNLQWFVLCLKGKKQYITIVFLVQGSFGNKLVLFELCVFSRTPQLWLEYLVLYI